MDKEKMTEFAKLIAETNHVAWSLVCMCEEITASEEYQYFMNNKENLKVLAEILKQVNSEETSYISTEMHGRDLVDFEELTCELYEIAYDKK